MTDLVIFTASFIYITIYAVAISFINKEKIPDLLFWFLFGVFLIAVGLAARFQLLEKTREQHRQYVDMVQRQQEAKTMAEIRGKLEEGTASDKDALKYIAYQIGELSRTFENSKHIKYGPEYLLIYFDAVSKIPGFYPLEEWLSTEAFIYEKIKGQIDASYNFLGVGSGGMGQRTQNELQRERDKLIAVKKRITASAGVQTTPTN